MSRALSMSFAAPADGANDDAAPEDRGDDLIDTRSDGASGDDAEKRAAEEEGGDHEEEEEEMKWPALSAP